MWSHRLTFIGLLYTEREIFVVMSSGDEGKQILYSVVLFSKLRNRLRVCPATNHGFYNTK